MLCSLSFLLLMILEVRSLGASGSTSRICKVKCENSVCEIHCPTSNGIVKSQCDSKPLCLFHFCIKNSQEVYCPCSRVYTDDQFEECYPECKINSECPPQLACINKKCVNPCRGSCGRNATCDVIDHNPICRCNERLVGDPFISCHSKNIWHETYAQEDGISGIEKLNYTVRHETYVQGDGISGIKKLNDTSTDYIYCSLYKTRGKLFHNTRSMLHQDKPFKFIVELEPGVKDNEIPKRIWCHNADKVSEEFINTSLNHDPGDEQYVYTADIDTAVYYMTAKWSCMLQLYDSSPITYGFDVNVTAPVSSTPVWHETYAQGDGISGIKKLNDTGTDYIYCSLYKTRGKLFHKTTLMLHLDKPFKFIVELEPGVMDNEIPKRIRCHNADNVSEVFINTSLNHDPGDEQYVYTADIDTAVYTMTAKWSCMLQLYDSSPITYRFDVNVTAPVSSTPESSSLTTILIIACSVTLIVILIIAAITVWRKMDSRVSAMNDEDHIYEEVIYATHPAGASSEPAPRPACPLPEGTVSESREYVYDIVYESRVRRLWEARWFAHKRSERAEEIRRLAAGVPCPRA